LEDPLLPEGRPFLQRKMRRFWIEVFRVALVKHLFLDDAPSERAVLQELKNVYAS